MVLSTTSVTVNSGDPFELYINVKENDNPVTGVFFNFEGIPLNIGENQLSFGNGTYLINASSALTQGTEPGNYSGSLVASLSGTEVARSNFNLSIIRVDIIAPSMTITNPTGTDISSDTLDLALIATDNIGWRSLEVKSNEVSLYYLLNSGYNVTQQHFTYNMTYLELNININLRLSNTSLSDHLVVELLDTSYNNRTVVFNLIGDYIAPIISFTSHQDNEVIHSLDFDLSWDITDDSAIKSQNLTIFGTTEVQQLAGSVRSTTIKLSLATGVTRVLRITLSVEDTAGNIASKELIIQYIPDEGGAGNGNSLIGQNQTLLLIGVILGVLVFIGSAFGLYRQFSATNDSPSSEKLPRQIRKFNVDNVMSNYQDQLSKKDLNVPDQLVMDLKFQLEQIKKQSNLDATQTKIMEVINYLDMLMIEGSYDDSLTRFTDEYFKSILNKLL